MNWLRIGEHIGSVFFSFGISLACRWVPAIESEIIGDGAQATNVSLIDHIIIFMLVQIVALYWLIENRQNKFLSEQNDLIRKVDETSKLKDELLIKAIALGTEHNNGTSIYSNDFHRADISNVADDFLRSCHDTVNHPEAYYKKIWKDHAQKFVLLKPGESFLSTCLVPSKEEDIKKIFEDASFKDYWEKICANSASNNIEVSRVMILCDVTVASRSQPLLQHLQEAKKYRKIKVKFLDRSTAEQITSSHGLDFMIWGNHYLSVSSIKNNDGVVEGYRKVYIKKDIDDFQDDFNKLFRRAEYDIAQLEQRI